MADVDCSIPSFNLAGSQAPYHPLALPHYHPNRDRYNERYPYYPFSALTLHYALMVRPFSPASTPKLLSSSFRSRQSIVTKIRHSCYHTRRWSVCIHLCAPFANMYRISPPVGYIGGVLQGIYERLVAADDCERCESALHSSVIVICREFYIRNTDSMANVLCDRASRPPSPINAAVFDMSSLVGAWTFLIEAAAFCLKDQKKYVALNLA